MSYVVLARKYRPQNFDEVYAQEHVTTILKNAISLDRLAHALLFSGSRGVGKTSMARILAKSLNCIKGVTSSPCNECDNCLEITNGTSTDVIEIDGASHTSVEDIRDLQKELMYSASKSEFKIYIIDEVHMLSKNAFNALLKTLEEPPSQVIFIFATTEPHKVLPTIISRCQRYDFKKIPVEDIVKRLDYICQKEELSIEKEALYIIAKKAEGSLRDALSLTDQLLATSKESITTNDVLSLFGIVHNDVFKKITLYLHDKKTAAIITLIHSLLDKGNDLQEFLGGYLDYLRNLLLIKTNVPLPELPHSIKQDIQEITTLFSEDTILYIMAILIKAKNEIRYFSNPNLLIEMTFIKLAKMEEMKSVEELLDKLCNHTHNLQTPSTQSMHKRPEYYQKGKNEDTVKEPKSPKLQYSQITDEIFSKEKNALLSTINESLPFAAQYFSNLTLEKVEGKKMSFCTNTQLSLDYLNRERDKISKIISRYFGLDLFLSFSLNKSEAIPNETRKKNNSPSLNDIKRYSPDIAQFIHDSKAKVTHIKKKRFD